MKWSVGDKIMAKWPGSSLYYHAEIQSINNDEAGVLFHEGTEMSVPVKDIKVSGIMFDIKHGFFYNLLRFLF